MLRHALDDVRTRHPFQARRHRCSARRPALRPDTSPRRCRLLHALGPIKVVFYGILERNEGRSEVRAKRGRGIWQRRFWEHCIRDGLNCRRHVDCFRWNPVKHGYVRRASDWLHSGFHRYVARSVYPMDWGGGERVDVEGLE